MRITRLVYEEHPHDHEDFRKRGSTSLEVEVLSSDGRTLKVTSLAPRRTPYPVLLREVAHKMSREITNNLFSIN